MSDDNARFKQRLELQQDDHVSLVKGNSREIPPKSEQIGGFQSESREWRRFYEAIKQITENLRQ